MRLIRLAALAVLPALAACSGTGPVTDGPGPDGPDPGVPYPAYETVDVSDYDRPPPARVEIVHDVPERTMEGTVVVPGSNTRPNNERAAREVDGFRIQVGRSESRQTAERLRDAVLGWWEDARDRRGAPARLEVVVVYVQPYYRVRVGAFEFQREADQTLPFIRGEYPNAFIVPDRVTVR